MTDKPKPFTHIFSGRHVYALLDHVVKGVAPDYWGDPQKYHSGYVKDLPVIFPELDQATKYQHLENHKLAIPKHPADIVVGCRSYVGKTIVTVSEHVILYMLRQVADKKMKPTELQITHVGLNGEYKVIRVDEDGELIDKWPGGFFDERAELLFGDDELCEVEGG